MAGTVASPLLDMVSHRLDCHTRVLSKSTDFIKMRLKLAETLAFLEETEHHESGDNSSLRIWLAVLRDLAYDVDVLIDDWEQQSNKVPLAMSRSSSKIEKELRRIHGHLVSHLDSYCRLVPDQDVAEKAIPEMDLYGSNIVYERYSEISEVINTMLSGNDGKILCVIPIVGMGGIGKTVFARRIFNDDEVRSHFQVRAWVSLSENLDLARIEESVAAECSTEKVLAVREVLEGKKFLLVLDNMWDEDGEKLQELKEWLITNVGDSGSCCVLLTTRSSRVAALAGTVPAKQLECWSDEDSSALFRCLAFGSEQDARIEFEKIGEKIVAKCKGLPLAIKVIGGLLRYKNKQEWLSIRRCDLSNLPEFKACVLPVLKLSYDHLLPYLKQCFVYCSIFPKGYWINKEKLVRLWIAEGFIRLESGNKGLEDIANDYFSELFQNSFFLDVMRDDFGEVAWCRMHDLMHDLAQSVAGVECDISLSQIGEVVSHKMHDLIHDLAQFVARIECSLLSMGYPRSVQGRVQYCSMVTPEPGKLRTLLLLSGKLENVASIFHMFSRLRVLDLSQSGLIELPVSIGILKHLRYLDLSHTYIRKMPNSISKLKQLQTLELSNCYNLEELPKAITQLTKLRNLGISSCCSLIHIPSGIGKLRLLRKLPAFILGKRSDSAKLRELNWLNLEGRLEIKNLENVKILVDAEEAKIHEKVHIHSLELSWSRNANMRFYMCAEVLEILRPPVNLKILCIKGYRGSNFPGWMNWDFPNLVKVSLIDCCFRKLPPLGGLPSLQDLYIKGLPAVLSIDDEFYGIGVVKGFPSLQQLEIYDMPNLVEWKSLATVEGQQFPYMEKLTVEGCRMLTTLPFAPNLKNLAICNSNETLLYSLHNFPSLPSLVIDNFHELEGSPGDPGNQNSITKLTIHNCDSLEILFAAVQSFSSIRHLSILHCDKADFLPMSLGMLDSLQKLDIVNCPRLVQIPDILQQLSLLVELKIENCPILELMPESIRFLSCVQRLMIRSCPLLERQLEMETARTGASRISSKFSRSSTPSTPTIPSCSEKSHSECLPTPRSEGEILSSPNLKAFTFNELKCATRNFRPVTLLGEDEFCYVFKGWIDEHTLSPAKPGSGMVVAVKKLKPEGFQGHKEWLTEVNYLGQLHHPNIIKLIGYCLEGENRLLVYEFMPKGNLENHLFRRGLQPLSWAVRIKVAIGAARGLSFLHDAKPQVIYRDFKASNILLDAEFNAKLSGFGLAKAGPTGDRTHVSTQVMGTHGYAAPEYVAIGQLTAKSDVYSFGVVLLELLTGRCAVDKTKVGVEQNLVDWAKPYLSEKRKFLLRIMDTKLGGQYPQKGAYTAATLALQCLNTKAKLRPQMFEVLAALERLEAPKNATKLFQSEQQRVPFQSIGYS